MKKRSLLLSLGVLLLLLPCACDNQETSGEDDVIGYIPVYGDAQSSDIVMVMPKPVVDPGKIYVYGKYLLVNERKKGIHVFDNSNPADPVPVGFLQLLGNTDMAIKDGVLYADHLGNLVSLTTNDFTTIEEKGRLPLRNWNLGVPPPKGYYFECVDPDKGLVVSWKKTKLTNPACYALQ